MLELLGEGKHIINVDESWINETNFTRKMWAPYGSTGTLTSQIVAPRLVLIAALDTDGIVYLSLTQTTTDSDILMLFFRYLIRHLDILKDQTGEATQFFCLMEPGTTLVRRCGSTFRKWR